MAENGLVLLQTEQGACSLVRNGLSIAPGLTYEQWSQIRYSLDALGRSLQFAIGDWINYGECNYGEKYTQAIEFTEYNYHSLINLAAVARRVPMSSRKDSLFYSHHSTVAYVDDPNMREWLLEEAAEQGWTVRQLRARVQEEQGHDHKIVSTADGRVCPQCGYEFGG